MKPSRTAVLGCTVAAAASGLLTFAGQASASANLFCNTGRLYANCSVSTSVSSERWVFNGSAVPGSNNSPYLNEPCGSYGTPFDVAVTYSDATGTHTDTTDGVCSDVFD